MPWYYYLLHFVAGVFLANGVPHFVQGICGNRFQTPFASPPGVGESSAVVNVVWGWVNLLIAGILLRLVFPVLLTPLVDLVVLALGGLLIAVWLANHFSKVRTAAPHP
jgi:hypothetical protein